MKPRIALCCSEVGRQEKSLDGQLYSLPFKIRREVNRHGASRWSRVLRLPPIRTAFAEADFRGEIDAALPTNAQDI
jgi:hypothetical protein